MAKAKAAQQEGGTILQPELTEGEKAVRDTFVHEYMKDFDAFNAALRTGFQPQFALDWAKKLYQDSYVQSQIVFLTRKHEEPTPESALSDRAFALNNLKRLMVRGSEASQVAATKTFIEMNGWAKPEASQDAAQDLVEAFKEIAKGLPV